MYMQQYKDNLIMYDYTFFIANMTRKKHGKRTFIRKAHVTEI